MVSETTNQNTDSILLSGHEMSLIHKFQKHGVSHEEIGLETLYPIIQQKLRIEFEYPSYSATKWSFKQLSDYYQQPNTICLSNALGVNYDHSYYDKLTNDAGLKYKGVYRGTKINRILCSKFHCERCRTLLKNKLKTQIQIALTEHKLYTHFVITTEGTNYRDTNDYVQSYTDMSIAWNKIRKILSYDAKKQGKHFSYICLFRSQKNGYCHLHVLTNAYIPKQRLQDISKKYFNTGFIKIKSNKDITKYLTNDFMKDHEFYIPFGRRHYTTSRNIDLKVYEDFDEELKNPETTMHIHLQSGVSIVDQVYDQIEHEYGYPPPFDFLLQHFGIR